MRYAHASGEDNQAPEDKAMQPEHVDAVAVEGRRNSELIRGGDIQTHRRRRHGVHRGGGDF